MESFTFSVDGQKLAAHLFASPEHTGKKPGALFIHGWMSGQDRSFNIAEVLAQKGFVCLTFDMRGHGESEGDIEALTRKEFLQDVTTAYDELAKRDDVDGAKITVIGSSFGSYLATLLSGERAVHQLVLRVPSDYPDEGFTDRAVFDRLPNLDKWRTQTHEHTETKALTAIHKFQGRMLVVESENDEQIPAATVRNFVNAAPNPKLVTHYIQKGAPHSLKGYPEFTKEYEEIVVEWMGL